MSEPVQKHDSDNKWLGWLLAIFLIFLAFFGTAVLGSGLDSRSKNQGEKLTFGMDDGTGAQTDCPSDSLQKFRRDKGLWRAMNANLPTYKAAASENNISWEMLAALHYREHTFSPSDPNGEGPFQLTSYYDAIQSGRPPSYKGKVVTAADIRDFSISARLASDILQQKVSRRGGPITPGATDTLVKDAFWGYNGRAYGSADRSPYVMNHFDEAHDNMRISGFVRNIGHISTIDSKDGAFTVYYLLKYLGKYDSSGNLIGFTDCSEPSGSGSSGGGGATAVGDRIVAIARGYIGTTTVSANGDGNVFRCNAATRSCASFVSTVLQEAGAMTGFYARATDIWNQGGGTTVIERGGKYDAEKLQPGDVVFFGNGNTGVAGSIFNHVGIYIGDGQIIDTSSSQKKVVGPRAITVHSGSNSFNGAKRFGN